MYEVPIRILGDFAIIHARTSYQSPTVPRVPAATPMIGRCWQCVSARVTRL
jgi:hypothetical protein